MQAGRELDVKVAEALGYTQREKPIFDDGETINGYVIGDRWYSHIPSFSTTWEDMGVLVKEAEKKGILLDYEHFRESRYMGRAWKYCEKLEDWICIKSPVKGETPHAVSLAFLRAIDIAI